MVLLSQHKTGRMITHSLEYTAAIKQLIGSQHRRRLFILDIAVNSQRRGLAGELYPQPIRGPGQLCSFPSWVWGTAPAASEFSAVLQLLGGFWWDVKATFGETRQQLWIIKTVCTCNCCKLATGTGPRKTLFGCVTFYGPTTAKRQ